MNYMDDKYLDDDASDYLAVTIEEQREKKDIELDEIAAIQRYFLASEDIRPSLSGVVSVTIRSLNFSDISNMNYSSNDFNNIYVILKLRTLSSRTKIIINNSNDLSFNQTLHFPASVIKNKRHPYNLLSISVYGFDMDIKESINIGNVYFHLHDIISMSPIFGSYDLWNNELFVGTIDLEITFNYGMFGYGYSNQLNEHLSDPSEMCTYSLFPRINPSEGLSKQTDNIISLTATIHPSFIPFNCKVLLSYGLDIYPLLKNNKSLTYIPKKKNKILSQENENEIKEFFDYYYSIRDRGRRILLLHKYFLNEKVETNIHDTSDRKDNHIGNISEALNMKIEKNSIEENISSKFYIQFVNQVKNLFSSFFKKEKKA
ncbi:hypothetical protein BCR32DRAFT_270629 [Anaeromyces robustus]|uniref:C2 domain-containing protein n=1 Tax=Anaeromyces robustus TaxID=1754192 RepID=A0A1Y1WW18_9FUNG|nr:hypothetical protein BCR32DRAFT_270629 [Anaeromyces robustus]|eukprot:ORX77508.1 hypothetical protein BCR32DRAFT_270629 [Anaeromyces robustus]